MSKASNFKVDRTWRIMLEDLGLRPENVLRRAGLPDDLLGRDKATLSPDEYFQLWRGMVEEANDPLLPLKLGSGIGVEAFEPPIFAALCSPDLNTALRRIAHYKRLIGPLKLHVQTGDKGTRLEFEWIGAKGDPPAALMGAELAFFVRLARLATRSHVVPLRLHTPAPLEPAADYEEYFGVPVLRGERVGITFKASDARAPFLAANEAMWKFFEPEFERRLSQLEAAATAAERVEAALLELLPGGAASMVSVSKKLGTSKRTLQRRLRQEGLSFRDVLNTTRATPAKHYLRNSSMTGGEISFLLGFEDPNSFFRAFQSWTGETPEQARSALQSLH